MVNHANEQTAFDREQGSAATLMKQIRRSRAIIAKELPDLIEKDQRLCDAMQEPTTSGALRRAIHSSKILLPDLAERAQTNLDILDAFLTGEQPLTSDVIDRLATILKLKLEAMGPKQKPRASKAVWNDFSFDPLFFLKESRMNRKSYFLYITHPGVANTRLPPRCCGHQIAK